MAKFECSVCGYIYNEQYAGRPFSEIDSCPICGGVKSVFKQIDADGNVVTDSEKNAATENIQESMETAEAEKVFEEKENIKDETIDILNTDGEVREAVEGNEGRGFTETVETEAATNEVAEAKSLEAEPAAEQKTEESPKTETPFTDFESEEISPNRFNGFVVEKRQEFWKTNEENKPQMSSAIQSIYDTATPVGTVEEKEEKEREKEKEHEFKPLWNAENGSVHTVITPEKKEPEIEKPVFEEVKATEAFFSENIQDVSSENEENNNAEDDASNTVIEEIVSETDDDLLEFVEVPFDTEENNRTDIYENNDYSATAEDYVDNTADVVSVESMVNETFFNDDEDEADDGFTSEFKEIVDDDTTTNEDILETMYNEEISKEVEEAFTETAEETAIEETVDKGLITEDDNEVQADVIGEEVAEDIEEAALEETIDVSEDVIEVIAEDAEEVVTEELAMEAAEEVVTEELTMEAAEEVVTEELAMEAAEEVVTEELAMEAAEEVVTEELAMEAAEVVTEELAEDEAEAVIEEITEDVAEAEAVTEELPEEAVENITGAFEEVPENAVEEIVEEATVAVDNESDDTMIFADITEMFAEEDIDTAEDMDENIIEENNDEGVEEIVFETDDNEADTSDAEDMSDVDAENVESYYNFVSAFATNDSVEEAPEELVEGDNDNAAAFESENVEEEAEENTAEENNTEDNEKTDKETNFVFFGLESDDENGFVVNEEVPVADPNSFDEHPGEEMVVYSMLKGSMKYSVLCDEQAKKVFESYPVDETRVSNGLENIILLPAQLNPMPLPQNAEVDTTTVLGALTACPVEVLQPFCFSKLFLWGEHIPNNENAEEYNNQAFVLVKGKNGHIPDVASKVELKDEVEIARERFHGTPVGIDLVAGRIEQDLEACVYANMDFVILNDVSSRILPYALRKAKNYLNKVNAKLDLLVCVDALKDAQELAKLLALGADFVLVERGFDLESANRITEDLKEIARSTGHDNVHDINMFDICTIDSDIANNTDISHI